MKPTAIQFDMFGGAPAAPEAPTPFRLTRFQVFNWGTFNDLVDIAIAEKGFLFVGPSGAGKSTLLDANSTLMTPPKWLGFNQAAREGESGGNQDRNLMTYIRGAWAQQTGKNGEAVQQYLRENTTWSALAQTYTAGPGRAVTVAQVFWVRGKTADRKEIKRSYLVIERAFDLRELQPFADKDFDLKLLRALQGVSVHDEFSGYRERFSRLVGIEQESAMRLLHKTQSAKNLGELNEFLRDFMLDPPETFDMARKLVGHFVALREAHASVVDTRRQIEVLAPGRLAYQQLLAEREALEQLAHTQAALNAFKEQQKAALLDAQVAQLEEDIAEKTAAAMQQRDVEDELESELSILLTRRNGGAQAKIDQCTADVRDAESTLQTAKTHQALLEAVCHTVELVVPSGAAPFAAVQDAARDYVANANARDTAQRQQRDLLVSAQGEQRREQQKVQREIATLSRRRSNINDRLQQVRERLCAALSLREEDLPFAGELIEVGPTHRNWAGAAERVLHDFAEYLLVPAAHFPEVARFINQNHMGTLVKFACAEPDAAWPTPSRSGGLLADKLVFSTHALAAWVAARVRSRFDHVCVDTEADLADVRRGVTREGLIKTDGSTNRKDDRYALDDQSRWVLGGDTRAKLAHYMDRADVLDQALQALATQIAALEPSADALTRLRQCDRLLELDWDAVSLAAAEAGLRVAHKQLALAKEVAPDSAALEAQIAQVSADHKAAQKKASQLEAQCQTLRSTVESLTTRRASLRQALLEQVLGDAVVEGLLARYAEHTPALAWDNIEEATSKVKDGLAKEERAVQSRATGYLHALTNQLRDYMREWPAKAASLDATEASAPEFFAILTALEEDGLPQHETRFLELLQQQGTQEMMALYVQLVSERKAIQTRLTYVNAILKTAPFNTGTHLVIEYKDKMLPEVMAFRQNLKEAYSNWLQDKTPEEIERRFNVLNDIVVKLETQDAACKAWRDVCLDVRRQVEFTIHEIDAAGTEVEVYRSGAGKSGGQRQKLTATCLAAALRYQLGGKEAEAPMFSTVFMDEAFDKADAEFTNLAMNIFKTFGFQLVVATPLKSVMTLEPYIGGACFVHIEARKHSRIVPITYLESANKLNFQAAGLDVDTLNAE